MRESEIVVRCDNCSEIIRTSRIEGPSFELCKTCLKKQLPIVDASAIPQDGSGSEGE